MKIFKFGKSEKVKIKNILRGHAVMYSIVFGPFIALAIFQSQSLLALQIFLFGALPIYLFSAGAAIWELYRESSRENIQEDLE